MICTSVPEAKVLHLHGELTKARSVDNPHLITAIGYEPFNGEIKQPTGSAQTSYCMVWRSCAGNGNGYYLDAQSRRFLVVGTSLAVYPAAGD